MPDLSNGLITARIAKVSVSSSTAQRPDGPGYSGWVVRTRSLGGAACVLYCSRGLSSLCPAPIQPFVISSPASRLRPSHRGALDNKRELATCKLFPPSGGTAIAFVIYLGIADPLSVFRQS